ncbi:hypothetical protein E4L95_12445 [Paracoccus liaowanqingii]|uniref:Beta-lactamase class A catalytic domain-containing protein n=1 Tax=Paracoccus liaowanqingii TaxID=2560053 RepID=A0A4Z1BJY4_9RHOB|nr:serine hydrolase [Paracoccus liaowanqingii]TGN58386.1 hypothetical protein E4L95_12445 [Paracoccus liaowanqingii]
MRSTITQSDNTATNLLLDRVGGPQNLMNTCAQSGTTRRG